MELNNDFLLFILDSVPAGITVNDEKGNYIYENKFYQSFMGLEKYEFLGKNVKEFVNNKIISESAVILAILSKEKTIITQDVFKSNKTFTVISNPILNEKGEIIRVVSLLKECKTINPKIEFNEDSFILKSEKMYEIISLIEKVSEFDTTILITGESGVGKEIIAKLIHKYSHRKGKFIAVNCGAIPENLIESELFGYDEGAFTGAKRKGKIGLFEAAEEGTIFLDEIGELPLNVQVKLLRVLQEKSIIRVGSTEPIKINFRLLAATNKNLPKMVKERLFREDLYYRLNVIPILIPPLRERKEEIPLLINFFLKKYEEKYSVKKVFSPTELKWFYNYEWPGNIRQLENMIERILITNSFPQDINLKEISEDLNKKEIITLKDLKETSEKELLIKSYGELKSTRKVAKLLGVNQSTVVRKMKKYKINL